MPARGARTDASPPGSFISGIARPTARNWPPMMRGSMPSSAAIVSGRSAASRFCATQTRKRPASASMAAKMTAMSERSLEAGAPKGDLRARLIPVADGLVAAVAVSLPWSTSATGILIVLWLIALVPTLDVASVRREVLSMAGGLPVLLWALGAIGMLWADVSSSERIAGLSAFHKLLLVPLLLSQFRRGGRAQWAIVGFLAASIALLVASWVLVLTPGLEWRGKDWGVPVKNYILQSEIFAICA